MEVRPGLQGKKSKDENGQMGGVWAVWHLGKDRFPSKELRERLRTHNTGTTAKQAAMV